MSAGAATGAGKPLPDCNFVPGSLGGYRSVPWCIPHGRYAAACEAAAAERERIVRELGTLVTWTEPRRRPGGPMLDKAAVLRIVRGEPT